MWCCRGQFGLTVIPKAAKSLPFVPSKAGAVKPQDLVDEARVTVHVHPRRRRRGRHWRCWWHRGRRVCGTFYVLSYFVVLYAACGFR